MYRIQIDENFVLTFSLQQIFSCHKYGLKPRNFVFWLHDLLVCVSMRLHLINHWCTTPVMAKYTLCTSVTWAWWNTVSIIDITIHLFTTIETVLYFLIYSTTKENRIWSGWDSLTLSYVSGVHICSHYHSDQFFYWTFHLRRLQVYSIFKFRNYVTTKFGLVSKKISYGPLEALKVRRVANFFAPFYAWKLVTILL